MSNYIEVYPLGAGQEIGRSCIIINILDKTIMLDCGLHMTHTDNRRFPDFAVRWWLIEGIADSWELGETAGGPGAGDALPFGPLRGAAVLHGIPQ